jgi:hypothetical protein
MRQTPRLDKIVAPCAAALLLAGLWLLPAQAQDVYSQGSQSYGFSSAQGGAAEPQEAPVPFNHNEHNKKAKLTKCATCHHPLPGVKRTKANKSMERNCADCHHQRPAPTDRAASLMVVSHKLCQDCHKARKKGPVNCSGCHKTEAAKAPAAESATSLTTPTLFPSTPALTPSSAPAPATGSQPAPK